MRKERVREERGNQIERKERRRIKEGKINLKVE